MVLQISSVEFFSTMPTNRCLLLILRSVSSNFWRPTMRHILTRFGGPFLASVGVRRPLTSFLGNWMSDHGLCLLSFSLRSVHGSNALLFVSQRRSHFSHARL